VLIAQGTCFDLHPIGGAMKICVKSIIFDFVLKIFLSSLACPVLTLNFSSLLGICMFSLLSEEVVVDGLEIIKGSGLGENIFV